MNGANLSLPFSIEGVRAEADAERIERRPRLAAAAAEADPEEDHILACSGSMLLDLKKGALMAKI